MTRPKGAAPEAVRAYETSTGTSAAIEGHQPRRDFTIELRERACIPYDVPHSERFKAMGFGAQALFCQLHFYANDDGEVQNRGICDALARGGYSNGDVSALVSAGFLVPLDGGYRIVGFEAV